MLVLELHSLCSGMTAKSSGIVRCHYGVPSLAAMAKYGIEVFAAAEEIFGVDVGYRQTGYLVGVDAGNVDALHANVAMQRGLGIAVELVGHDDVAQMWPGMRLDDFAAFAYEPQGGHGDAYLSGMTFAKRARELGVRIRQHSPVTGLVTSSGGEVVGVSIADGEVVSDTIVLAAGAWSAGLAAFAGVDSLPVAHEAVRTEGSPGRQVHQVPPRGRHGLVSRSRDRRIDDWHYAATTTADRDLGEDQDLPHPPQQQGQT